MRMKLENIEILYQEPGLKRERACDRGIGKRGRIVKKVLHDWEVLRASMISIHKTGAFTISTDSICRNCNKRESHTFSDVFRVFGS